MLWRKGHLLISQRLKIDTNLSREFSLKTCKNYIHTLPDHKVSIPACGYLKLMQTSNIGLPRQNTCPVRIRYAGRVILEVLWRRDDFAGISTFESLQSPFFIRVDCGLSQFWNSKIPFVSNSIPHKQEGLHLVSPDKNSISASSDPLKPETGCCAWVRSGELVRGQQYTQDIRRASSQALY